ncbi:MAG: hypothetical protein Q7V31_15795 [Parvibaculum sp.]|uniref:hypothetical protein n=1 Tax=Parvibaculum sp. TaxID=2024848 RepID=UPI002725826B|nr:hypothetical protein [Parvibaculum sp.]MDO8840376.1 hypothetical protein [Parvibaculum sp.]
MGKLFVGFVLGFLACTWTYGINPTEAAFGLSHKIAAARDHLQTEYNVERPLGHKGQYAWVGRNGDVKTISAEVPHPTIDPLEHRRAYWLSQAGGLPPM